MQGSTAAVQFEEFLVVSVENGIGKHSTIWIATIQLGYEALILGNAQVAIHGKEGCSIFEDVHKSDGKVPLGGFIVLVPYLNPNDKEGCVALVIKGGRRTQNTGRGIEIKELIRSI